MHSQQDLERILKKKGIGPQGSKSVSREDLDLASKLLAEAEVNLTTKATFLTAMLTLEPTLEEDRWLHQLKRDYKDMIPPELFFFMDGSGSSFEEVIRKTVSKTDLSYDEAHEGMECVMNPSIPAYLKGAFLEAQRLKRETRKENRAFYEVMQSYIQPEYVEVPTLLDLCDSYDGCTRTFPLSVFTAPVLAACGLPTLLHGIDVVAPKEGISQHQILEALGKKVDGSPTEVKQTLMNPEIRWAYLDQQQFFPALYALKSIRKAMVKRPFLATFEKLLRPIRTSGAHLMLTSYTHGHYKMEVAELVQEVANPHRLLHLKGMEGTTMPPLTRQVEAVKVVEGNLFETILDPSAFGMDKVEASPSDNKTAEEAATRGYEVLKGAKGYFRDQVIYHAAVCLHHFLDLSVAQATEQASKAVDSGAALAFFDQHP